MQVLSRVTIALAITALHVGIRVRSALTVFGSDEQRPLFAGADSFYHAHRTHLLFEHAPALVYFDPFMLYPRGAIAEWSLGFDYIPANLLRLLTPSWERAVMLLPFTTLTISLLALPIVHALARTWLTPVWSLAATFCFGLNLAFVRVSSLAEYDHHVVETLAVVLLMLMPSALARARLAALLGASMAWAIWNSTLIAYLVSAYLWLLLLFVQLGRVERPRVAPIALGLLAPLTVFVALEASARAAPLSLTTLSLFHLAAVAAPLLGLWSSSWAQPRKYWLLVTLVAVFAAGLTTDQLGWLTSFALGADPVLGSVNETRALFVDADGFSATHAHLFLGPALLLFPWSAWTVLRHATSRHDARFLTVVFAIMLFVGALWQKRLVHLCVPGYVLVLFLAAQQQTHRRLAGLVVTALLLEPVVAFFPETASAVPPTAGTALRVASVVREAARGQPLRGVSAPPNFGSAINFIADLPSVTNAFFYPKYLMADLAVRELTSMQALEEHLRARRIGYLVALDDARYRTMLLRMVGDPRAAQAAVWERTPCEGELLRFALDRLACGVELPDSFQLLYRGQLGVSRKRLYRRLVIVRLSP